MQLTKFATKLYGTNDFFFEHRYVKFQDKIQYNNGTLKHRHSESFCGCNRRICCF